jgi:hypothetical protein
MKPVSVFDREALQRQIDIQTSHAWDLETSFDWHLTIDTQKIFVPLDKNNFVFPGASSEQSLAISHLLGLMINETICEMECSLPRLKFQAWEKVLDRYPVNREMQELGEMFFDEEDKHAKSFQKFFEKFCHQLNIDPKELRLLLPSGHNSNFQKLMIKNAELGGAAFWWTVASVEETSIQVFRAMTLQKKNADPLYFQLHQRHAEEESRHDNYAFMMIDIFHQMPKTLKERVLAKTDNLLAELLPGPWVLTELMKIYKAKEFAHRHPFFQVIAESLPLLEQQSRPELLWRFINSTPYISWLVNPAFRKKQRDSLQKVQSLRLPLKERKVSYAF